ncbi:hypothetical protein ZWY2020_052101 [Hordeum vulgare]|nr:hypothetical protein ZWY2020_052101 [Hordeum vulgare]
MGAKEALAERQMSYHAMFFQPVLNILMLTISRFTITRKQKLLVGLGSATACRSWRLCRRIKATVQRRYPDAYFAGTKSH